MPRGDGRLTNDLNPHQPGPQDECGVFGVWAPGRRGRQAHLLRPVRTAAPWSGGGRHRGQRRYRRGRLQGSRVWWRRSSTRRRCPACVGHIAIGHTRYSTTGGSTWENAQPTLRATAAGDDGRAAARRSRWPTTGTWSTRPSWPARSTELGHCESATSDSAMVTSLLAPPRTFRSRRPRWKCCRRCRARSASCSWTRTRSTRPVTRTACARWCSAGSSGVGWWPARRPRSDIVGASVVREVEPGELLAIDEHGLRSSRFANPDPKGCLFEYVYLARPDTTIAGRSVYAARVQIGRTLAREHPVEADLVIPVPESGTPAAIGYAKESGIPYGAGLVKNGYVGRTFIQPSQTIRELGIRLKLNPLREVIRGKRIVVVDDSIVRGNDPAGHRAHAAGGRRHRGACPHLVPAGHVALLLRHRLRHQGRAAGQRARQRRHPPLDRRRLARLRLAGRPDRRVRAAEEPALPGLFRRASIRSRCRPTT